ncbi:hypothetical protein [Leptospira yasudae]|uniref:Uncharacterized protein n=1 Tax=Leptospira yasudae TaxID=2202201 RepID=A0A6N4QCI0_9LEPT|nr:hypothetical protein EHQ72_17395 [Leptospira yasudae]TGL76887.1 hypothetical protein EHQ77_17705 [Leptospira yasudae]TGL78235.1 hypothetical protein EHQ83_19900 [Leptospira yasudae]
MFLCAVFCAGTPINAIESRVGATGETYESRYTHTAKENWFLKTSNCPIQPDPKTKQTPTSNDTNVAYPSARSCWTGFFETRNGTPLFSAKVDHKTVRASFGHRFRPLENFYFLRDNDFYTALPEIDQAVHRSGFFGLLWKGWSLGTYYSEQEAKRRAGYYFLSPKKLFEAAYSPEVSKHYVSLNFQSNHWNLPGPRIVSRIQTVGEKKEIGGTFYTSMFSERLDSEFRLTGYRGKTEDLFALDPNRNELRGQASLARFGLVSHSAFSMEWIRAWNRPSATPSQSETNSFNLPSSETIPPPAARRWEIIGGKAPIVYDPSYGGILLSLRSYTNETIGRGMYYGLYRNRFTIEAGQEWRINGDAITEGKWSFRIAETWNLEGAFLFQKEGNRTDSLFEARTARDETSLIFTDRSSSFRLRLRLLSPTIAFTVSHSRKKESKSDGIWINLQVQFPF